MKYSAGRNNKLTWHAPSIEPLERRELLSAKVAFKRINFVSDGSAVGAARTDHNLVNGWGLAAGPGTDWWVADNGSGTATLYDANGMTQSLVVTVPQRNGASGPSTPTGQVFNGTNGFEVGPNWPAEFIFATEDGTISGWSPLADATHAILKVDNSPSGAVFKGLAMGTVGSDTFLYATDFHNGKVDVFDSSFQPANLAGSFHDKKIPHDYAPFGIQNINGLIYVTYASQDATAQGDVSGKGHGFVDVFNPDGTLAHRLARRGHLNSPWGIAQAPSSWGQFKHDLLVGNFGDGNISILDPQTGAFISYLQNARGTRIHTPGLWSLQFGNDGTAGSSRDLFFTAGPNHEADGLFGKFSVVRISHKSRASAPAPAPRPMADTMMRGGDSMWQMLQSSMDLLMPG